jgi:hypothetical protein
MLVSSFGCDPIQPQVATTQPDDLPTVGTPWKVTEQSISFAPGSCVRGSAGVGWGLGASSVSVLGRVDGFCIIDYRAEEEGGWSNYRIKVPVSDREVFIRYQNSIDYGAYTASGIVTSFELDEKFITRRGNLHIAPPKADAKPPIKWTQKGVPNTSFVNYLSDNVLGESTEVGESSTVKVQFTFFANDSFEEVLPGASLKPLEFKLDETQYGSGPDAALMGMKVGGTRYCQARSETCRPLTKLIGGFRDGSSVVIQIKLLEAK